MKTTARSLAKRLNSRFEGVVTSMYLDILGLVTTGTGNLIEPIDLAHAVEFVRADGSPASIADIDHEWHVIKGHTELAHAGWRAAQQYATLHLTEDGVSHLLDQTVDRFLGVLTHRFPEFDSWPAAAQCATMLMSWACGPGFRFPALAAALTAKDWTRAAETCHIDESGPDHILGTADDNRGLHVRNVAMPELYLAANHGDPEEINYAEPMSVRDVQTLLTRLAYDPGPIDGVEGAKTRAAVKLFQKDRSLMADGIVGPRTAAELRANVQ